jgi:hypothetical protein
MSISQTITGIAWWFASVILLYILPAPALVLGVLLAYIVGSTLGFIAIWVIMSIPVCLFIYGASMIKHGIVFCLLSIILLLSISPTYYVKSHKVEPNSEINDSGTHTYEEKINWVLLSIYIIIFIYGIYLILFVNLDTSVTPAITTES